MCSRAVSSARRGDASRRFQFVLVTTLALLLGSWQTASADRINYKEFHLHDGREGESGPWFVEWMYYVPVELEDKAEADTFGHGLCRMQFEAENGDVVGLGSWAQVPIYPVEVGVWISAREYGDGNFFAGSATILVYKPGNYSVTVNNSNVYATVTIEVHKNVQSGFGPTHMGLFAPSTSNDILVQGDREAGVPWPAFEMLWQVLSKAGFRLVDVEAYETWEGLRFTGVYQVGTGGHALVAGVDWPTFYGYWIQLALAGQQLIDIETYYQGGKPYFIGTYRSGSGDADLVDGDWDYFVARWNELNDRGLRLVDIETYVEASQRRYVGVYKKEVNAGYALLLSRWPDFIKTYEDLSEYWGLPLVDVESFISGKSRYYLAVYKSGAAGGALVSGEQWEAFHDDVEDLRTEGFRLIDLNIEFGISDDPTIREWRQVY